MLPKAAFQGFWKRVAAFLIFPCHLVNKNWDFFLTKTCVVGVPHHRVFFKDQKIKLMGLYT